MAGNVFNVRAAVDANAAWVWDSGGTLREVPLAGHPEEQLRTPIEPDVYEKDVARITEEFKARLEPRARREPERFLVGQFTGSAKKRKRPRITPTVVTGVASFSALTRAQYLLASQNLIPAVLRKIPGTKNPANIANYHRLFKKGLTAVCTEILGKKTMAAIRQKYSLIRDFFEVSKPTTQCNSTIGARRNEIPCWLCTFQLGTYNAQCEHKLPILFALLLTGLYDETVFTALAQNIRLRYTRELRLEYAWAHQRCNMIKSDTLYVKDETAGNDTIVLTTDDDAIQEDLDTIYDAVYEDWQPTSSQFQALVGASEQKTRDAWKAKALADIQSGLRPLITELNGKKLKKSGVFDSFQRGIKKRAHLFLQTASLNPRPSSRLSSRAQASLPRILTTDTVPGGTRRRNGRRRTYRGGVGGDDVLVEVIGHIYDIAKEANALFFDYTKPQDVLLDAALDAAVDAFGWVYDIKSTEGVLALFDAVVLAKLAETLGTPPTLQAAYNEAIATVNEYLVTKPIKREVQLLQINTGSVPSSRASAVSTPISTAAAQGAAPAPPSADQSAFQSPVINPYDTGAAFGSPQGARAAQAAPAPALGTLGRGSGSGLGYGANAGIGTPLPFSPATGLITRGPSLVSKDSASAAAEAANAATQQMEEGYEPPGNGYRPPQGGRRRTRKRRTLRRQRVRT